MESDKEFQSYFVEQYFNHRFDVVYDDDVKWVNDERCRYHVHEEGIEDCHTW